VNAPLLNVIAPPSNSFVLPRHKIVYIPVTKVACSALRWMVADLAGEDFSRFYRASGAHQSRLMTIHSNRTAWEFATTIRQTPPEAIAEISRDNGWFIFAVIRDPWTRLWSAWQSKFLVHHTPYVQEYGDEPWLPRIPTKPSEILDDWQLFVDEAPWRTHPALRKDRHFRTQYSAVRPQGVNYTKIYDLLDLSTLLADIHKHLRGLDLDQDLYTPRANESPLPMTAEALEHGVAERIRALYKRDFAEWGDRWELDKIKLGPGPLGMDAVTTVGIHARAYERIGDLARELQAAQERITVLETDLATRPPAPTTPVKPVRPAVARAHALAGNARRRLTRGRPVAPSTD
jgi:hypothetical protein